MNPEITHYLKPILCRARAAISRCIAFVGMVCLLVLCPPVRADDWPSVSFPKEVSKFDIAQEVTVNGLPMRIQGFVSASGPVQLADSFRHTLGKPLVENTLAGKLILGRAQGEHYISVQIEQAGSGSRGIVAVTNLKHAYETRSDSEAKRENMARRLPAGSQLVSQMSSVDGNKLSQHFIIMNGDGEHINRDWLKDMMKEDGFIFERETTVDAQKAATFPGAPQSGATQFYKGKGKEAMATIYRDGHGRTTTVLNIVNFVERRQ